MIKRGQIIKHRCAMDVCLLVDKVRGPYGPNQKVIITGDWINMGFVESYNIGERSKFETTLTKLNEEWQVCKDITQPCLRYAEWV